MAHNPFNDLYVDSLDDVMRDARRSWEITAAICNREVRQYQVKAEKSHATNKRSIRSESEPDSMQKQADVDSDI